MHTTPPLYGVSGGNVYCGPAAISAITGEATESITALTRERFGHAQVRGMYLTEIKKILSIYGYAMDTCAQFSYGHRPTVNQWRRFNPEPLATYLLSVLLEEGPHVMVMRHTTVIDSHLSVPTRLSKTTYGSHLLDQVDRITKL